MTDPAKPSAEELADSLERGHMIVAYLDENNEWKSTDPTMVVAALRSPQTGADISGILERAAIAVEGLFVEQQGHFPSEHYEDGYADGNAAAASVVRLRKLFEPRQSSPQAGADGGVRELATEVDGCFQAAYAEGLSERLAEADQDTGTLADLVLRRLVYAHHAAIKALASPVPAMLDREKLIDVLWDQLCPGIRQSEIDREYYGRAIDALLRLLSAQQPVATEREAIIEECAKVAEDYGWTIPMYAPHANVNAATDEVACMVTGQVATAIRALAQQPRSEGGDHK